MKTFDILTSLNPLDRSDKELLRSEIGDRIGELGEALGNAATELAGQVDSYMSTVNAPTPEATVPQPTTDNLGRVALEDLQAQATAEQTRILLAYIDELHEQAPTNLQPGSQD